MIKHQLRDRIAIGLILSHVFTIAFLLFVKFVIKGISYQDFTTAASIIVPVFAAFTTLIIRFFIKNPEKKISSTNDSQLSNAYLTISLLFPCSLVIYLNVIIFVYAYGIGINDIEQFKGMLVLGESAFGVYAAQIVSELFESKK